MKGTGGGGSACVLPPGRWNRFAASPRAAYWRVAYLLTAPHQGPAPRAAQGFTPPMRSPRVISAASTHIYTRGHSGRGSTGRGDRGGHPPGPLSKRDLQERERRNRQLSSRGRPRAITARGRRATRTTTSSRVHSQCAGSATWAGVAQTCARARLGLDDQRARRVFMERRGGTEYECDLPAARTPPCS